MGLVSREEGWRLQLGRLRPGTRLGEGECEVGLGMCGQGRDGTAEPYAQGSVLCHPIPQAGCPTEVYAPLGNISSAV